jgi:exopolysaccharide production protein ExoQ
MQKLLNLAENSFVILGLTFFSGGFAIGSDISSNTPGLIPDAVVMAIRYFIWIVSGLLLCVRWQKTLTAASRSIVLWILTLIILVSSVWSEFPDFTFLNSREVWQMTMFALYFASRFSLKQQVKLIALTLGIGAVLSLLAGVGMPRVGIHGADHPGSWKGIYDYKNTLGSMMVLGGAAFFVMPIDHSHDRYLKWGGLALSVLLMLLSTSKTSLILYFLLLALLFFYRNFRWRGKRTVIVVDLAILFVSCTLTLIFSNWVALIAGLGKDPTLTGRTPMWNVALTQLQERPWLGFGRGGFWAPGSKYAVKAGQAVADHFLPPHIHNGFLDLALDIGWIGFGLFMICFLMAYGWSLRRAYATAQSQDLWCFAFLTFLAMNNMTESFLLRLANIYWVLFVTVVLSVRQRRSPSSPDQISPATLSS